MADVITCPSGLTGRIRGMKVREERVLAEGDAVTPPGATTSLRVAALLP